MHVVEGGLEAGERHRHFQTAHVVSAGECCTRGSEVPAVDFLVFVTELTINRPLVGAETLHYSSISATS